MVSAYAKAGLFVVLLTALTMFDERLFDIHITSAGTDFFWRLFVMSVLVTGFFVSTVFSLLPQKVALSYISLPVYGLFATPIAEIVWMAVPLLVLLFINNRLK